MIRMTNDVDGDVDDRAVGRVGVTERSVGGNEEGEHVDREHHQHAHERDEALFANRGPLEAQRSIDEQHQPDGEGVLEVGE